MTLSYDCVTQNFATGDIAVGATVVVLEADGRCYHITRMTEEYCKVRERDIT